MKRTLALLGCVVLGALLFWSTGCNTGSNGGSAANANVTLSQYNEVHNGQSLDQVIAIFGGDPTQSGSATGPYSRTGSLDQWINADGSAALITFDNDVVVLKSEINLK